MTEAEKILESLKKVVMIVEIIINFETLDENEKKEFLEWLKGKKISNDKKALP